MGKTFHHLKFTQRKKIKEMLDMGIKKTEIAHSLGVHTATIYREIERGSVDGRYDPDYAENIYKRQLSEKGMQPLCIISPELAEYIAKLILDEGRSPAKIINMLQENPKYAVVPKSSATIYNAIDNGLIPGVTRENLNSDITTVFNDGQIHIAKWVRNEKLMNSPSNWFPLSFKCTRHSGSRVKTPGPLCLYSSGIQKLCWCHNHRIFYAGL